MLVPPRRDRRDPHSGSCNVGTLQPWEVDGARPEHWPTTVSRGNVSTRRGDHNYYMQYYPAKRFTYTRAGLPRVRERLRYTELLRDIRLGKVEYLIQWDKPIQGETAVVYTRDAGRLVKCAMVPPNDVRVKMACQNQGVPVYVQDMFVDGVQPGPGYIGPEGGSFKAAISSQEGQRFVKDARAFIPPAIVAVIFGLVRFMKWTRGDLADRDAMYKEQLGGRQFNKQVKAIASDLKDTLLKERLERMAKADGVATQSVFMKFQRMRKEDPEAAETAGFESEQDVVDFVRTKAVEMTRRKGVSKEAAAAALEEWQNATFDAGRKFRRSVKDERRGVDGKDLNLVYNKKEDKVTLDDVAGIGHLKGELREIVDFFKNKPRFRDSGAVVPRGILLVGPPGTGKTLIARAMAGEIDCNFFAINASEFCEIFAGVGAARVRRLFGDAMRAAPSIIFIDELDAVGRARNMTDPNEERNQTLNQLLTELDGFNPRKTDVVIMAATNRVDILDNALIRPGRFDRIVYVGAPDSEGREELFRLYASKYKLACDVEEIIEHSKDPMYQGVTGAAIAGLFNQAAAWAAKAGLDGVNVQALIEAKYGKYDATQVPTPSPEMAERGAYVAAGKVLALALLPGMPEIELATCGRGRFGELAWVRATQEDSANSKQLAGHVTIDTKHEMNLGIVGLLSGRAGEEVRYGPLGLSTMHNQELQYAKSMAMRMTMEGGMTDDDRLGWNFRCLAQPLIREREDKFVSTSDRVNTDVQFPHSLYEDAEEIVKQKLDLAYEAALELIRDNRVAFEEVAKLLVSRMGEDVPADELYAAVDKYAAKRPVLSEVAARAVRVSENLHVRDEATPEPREPAGGFK